MGLQNFSIFKKTFHTIIRITVFVSIVRETTSADPRFEVCEPQNCGNGPNISYPFWIPHKQESYCGYPNFKITCNNESPILTISDDDYFIRDIFYQNHSFVVGDTALYDDICPTPQHNFSLDRSPFYFSPSHAVLFIFYNCTSEPTSYFKFPVMCASNATRHSFAVFHEKILETNYSIDSCESLVEVPVDMGNEFDFTSLKEMNATEIMKKGFLLNWSANNCSNCERSGGRCGFDNNEFICFCHDQPHQKTCDDGNKRDWTLKVVIGVVAAIVGGFMMCVFFIIYQRRKQKRYVSSVLLSRNISSFPSSMPVDVEKGGTYLGLHIFTYSELEEATNNFDSSKELGDGGFGTVYHGKLRDGRFVAVKRLFENNCRRVEQFMNEVEILTRLHHQNLVTLYGCTSRHSRELLLVYEYIPNGTVADHLHGERAKSCLLTWPIRMSISIETANALSYLHASDIIHRDVKTNNILLDNNFCVKVADFGLSRLFPTDVTHISTAPQGTPGYLDPEYHQCYQLTDKSDVYSFGVVLIELISSKPAVDITRHRHDINLSNMAIHKIQNHALHELVDPCLGFETDHKVRRMITAVAELAFQCLQNEKDMRPSMEEVLGALEGIRTEADKVQKAEELDKPLLLSPDTVTAEWNSRSTTPNASS